MKQILVSLAEKLQRNNSLISINVKQLKAGVFIKGRILLAGEKQNETDHFSAA